jgi:alginate O-acetyltransferase complex protein AlgJ
MIRVSPRRLADLLLPVAVLGSIALVLALTDWHGRFDAEVERLEQRQVAVLPPLPRSVSAAYHYFAEFSHFVDDHYGLRQAAIGLRARIGFWLLGDTFASDVSVGQHRWLFLTGQGVLPDILHTTPLTSHATQTWAEAIEARRRWLAARGIRYVFVLAPDKGSIYPENLPRYRLGPGLTRREQLDARLAGQPAFLDLTDTLRAARQEGQVYYRWDTHWDRHGAYEAYRAVMQRLGLPAEPEDLGRGFDPENHVGDLGRLAGLTLTEHDRAPIHSPCVRTATQPDLSAVTAPRIEPDIPATTCAGGTGRLLMFHDSFAAMWAPWLSSQFARAAYVWRQPSFEDIKRMVDAEHPTVVIEEWVERFLVLPAKP